MIFNITTANFDIFDQVVPTSSLPSDTILMTYDEIQAMNSFYDKMEKRTGNSSRENPHTLSGQEFRKIPVDKLNHKIPGKALRFRSGFYKWKKDPTSTTCFVNQVIEWEDPKDARYMYIHFQQLNIKGLAVYHKENITGTIRMFWTDSLSPEAMEQVKYLKSQGYEIFISP